MKRSLPISAVLCLVWSGSTAVGQSVGQVPVPVAQVPGGGGLAGGGGTAPTGVVGGVKLYNAVQEAGGVDPGTSQVELDLAYSHRTREDHGFSAYSAVGQFSYALTDKFQLTLVAGQMTTTDSRDLDATVYDGSGLQAYYSVAEAGEEGGFGLALFQTVFAGPKVSSVETRVIVSYDRGPANLTYNLRLAHDFEGFQDASVVTTATLGHALGASWKFGKVGPFTELSLGVETTLDCAWEDYRRYAGTLSYVGPAIGVTFCERWSLSVTALTQLSDVDDQPRYQVLTALIYTF